MSGGQTVYYENMRLNLIWNIMTSSGPRCVGEFLSGTSEALRPSEILHRMVVFMFCFVFFLFL